jgi:hypothetical protein
MNPTASRRLPPGTIAAAAAILALGLGAAQCGCSKKTTAPAVQSRIAGRVTYEGGRSAADLDVSLISFGSTLVTITLASTDTAGHYAFVGPDPSSYVVYCRDFASHADAETVSVVSGPPRTFAADLTLRAAGKITGTATLAGLTDHRDVLLDVAGLLTYAATDSTGHFELTDVPPGLWTVEATHAGYANGSASASVPAPGDSVAIPPFQLVPGTPAARPRPVATR